MYKFKRRYMVSYTFNNGSGYMYTTARSKLTEANTHAIAEWVSKELQKEDIVLISITPLERTF